MPASFRASSRERSFFLALVLALLSLGAIGISLATERHAPQLEMKEAVHLAAAVSLQLPLAEVAKRFEKSHPSWRIVPSFASSGTVQRQVEQGAPFELVVMAAREQIDALARGGLIVEGSERLVARNGLVLAVPAEAPWSPAGVLDLQRAEVQRIALGEPKTVPVGAYAAQALGKLGLLASLRPKILYVSSARQVMHHIEMGHVEAGFVYASDARASARVRVAAVIDAALHDPIVYVAALVERASPSPGAAQFSKYLCSAEAAAIFARHGLLTRDTCGS